MLVNGKHYRTIHLNESDNTLKVIDQTLLPHRFEISTLKKSKDVIEAIKKMTVRGAPLIGVTAAYGIYLACLEAEQMTGFDEYVSRIAKLLKETRPTAVNLFYSIDKSLKEISRYTSISQKINSAREYALKLTKQEVDNCRNIGLYGLKIIEDIIKEKKTSKINVLTHCNAGWLACIDYGTATAAVYLAKEKGIDIHVWVEETRPRNQGASLTAWELLQNNVPHTVITDNAGGYVMQKGMVDIVIVGSDRTSANGDVCNKIGTYKTALAAKDNNIPFYAAVPTTSIDIQIDNGIKDIEIEERNGDEVRYITGLLEGELKRVLITPLESPVKNYGFDITPSRLVTGLITEKGLVKPEKEEILKLFNPLRD